MAINIFRREAKTREEIDRDIRMAQHLIKTEHDLAGMFSRRGYFVQVRKGQEDSTWFFVTRRGDMERNRSKSIWNVDSLVGSTYLEIETLIDKNHGGEGQHHVQCATCLEPLLRKNIGQIFFTAEGPSTRIHYPTSIYHYRSVLSGAESDPLSFCPQCAERLNLDTVREIEDYFMEG